MKKALAAILLLVYFAVTTGFSLSVHYCMDEFESASIGSSGDDVCDNCGMHKADGYSPVLGKYFYQDSVTINNRPDIALLVHFRIRSFKAFVRAENLNTANFIGGFQFNNNNVPAPEYLTPGLIMRFGIYWSFVN